MSVNPSKTIYIVILALAHQLTQINTLAVDKKLQDGWLYPGSVQNGIHLTYSEEPDWSDLWQTMTEKGFFTLGKLCIKGVFILYQEPQYEVPKPNMVEVLSGNSRCDMISENTKSIQLVGSMGHMYGPSITFFEKPYFGSAGVTTLNNVGGNFFENMERTRSAIMVGKVPWSLQLATGEKICLQPDFDPKEESPVCFVKDFLTLLDSECNDNDTATEGGNGDDADDDDEEKASKNNSTVLVRASQGCAGVTDENSIYRLQDCQYWGRSQLTKEVPLEIDDGLTGRSDIPKLCEGKEESDKYIYKLYKAVVTKTFDTDLIVGLDMVGKHSWKLDLLDWMFTIVTDIIADDIIPNSFLNKVRELFVHKLVTVWGNETEKDTTLSERNYKTLLRLTEKCHDAILVNASKDKDEGGSSVPGGSTASKLSDEFRTMWQNIQTIDDFKNTIISDFVRKPKLDIITEMVYIVGHMACYICHEDYMDSSHFWALYYNIFWSLYLQPVALEWVKPTVGLDIFFGGMDYDVEYEKLALFAGVTKKRARGLEVLTRPILPNGTIVQTLAFNDDVDARASDSAIPPVSGVESSF